LLFAEEAGQTLNVDLCFVPVTHQSEIKLPTVSGSSGKLAIQHGNSEPVFADYPGAVFADESLSYPEAMTRFVVASASEVKPTEGEIDTPNSEQAQLRAEKRALRQDEETLRQQRQRRQQEYAAFKTLKAERHAQQQIRQSQIEANQRPAWGSKKAADEQWKAIRQQRQEQMQQRQQEDAQWRTQREQLRLRAVAVAYLRPWTSVYGEPDEAVGTKI